MAGNYMAGTASLIDEIDSMYLLIKCLQLHAYLFAVCLFFQTSSGCSADVTEWRSTVATPVGGFSAKILN